ncbi:Gallate dioxygenase [bacterium HR10]|nr:Gallate dioxygenase [bacterium HR10]
MSVYRVNKLLHEVSQDRRLAERLATDPDEVFREYGLSAEEAEAIRNRRLRTLYEWGVNPYILLKGALALGVSVQEYPQRMNQPE